MKTINLEYIYNEIILIYLTAEMITSTINSHISFTDSTVILNEMTELKNNKLKKLKNRKLT